MHSLVQENDKSARFIDPTTGIEAARLTAASLEFYGVTFTATAEGAAVADRIDVTIQLTDRNGTPIAKQLALKVYPALADGTLGFTTATQTTLTGLDLWNLGPGGTTAHMRYLTAAGACSVGFTVAGAGTRRICVVLPDGRVIESATLTWV
jgi:hypothetical protein